LSESQSLTLVFPLDVVTKQDKIQIAKHLLLQNER